MGLWSVMNTPLCPWREAEFLFEHEKQKIQLDC
jgi:hypothetical protein